MFGIAYWLTALAIIVLVSTALFLLLPQRMSLTGKLRRVTVLATIASVLVIVSGSGVESLQAVVWILLAGVVMVTIFATSWNAQWGNVARWWTNEHPKD